MKIGKVFVGPIILIILYFYGCNPASQSNDDGNDIEITLTTAQSEDTIIFTIKCANTIYIPRPALASPPYPSGPWTIYHRSEETDTWNLLTISDICVSPWCDQDPCDPYAVCSISPAPPKCEHISGEYTFTWNKMHVIGGTQFCDGIGRSCYEFSEVDPGDYKVVFSFKTQPCLTYHEDTPHEDEKGYFYKDVRTIEKEFIIE